MRRLPAITVLWFALAALPSSELSAQRRPDFTGTWELDAAASRMIGAGGQVGPARLGERRIVWRIDHRDPAIAVTVEVRDPDRPHEFSFRCTTDGRPCVNELPELREVREMSALWSGDTLVMTQRATTPHGPFGADDRLALADSGKTLVFDRVVSDDRGRRTVRQILRKAGQPGTAPKVGSSR